MTSAKLFSKFCKENRRQKGWLWILSGLIFTVFTFTFFMQDVLMDSDEMYFGLYNTKMMWITLAVAVMIAFQGYGFLLQAKTVDFYYSLPVKRSHLFWGNYLNGIWVYLIPMLISSAYLLFYGMWVRKRGMERADRIFTLGNFRPCACALFLLSSCNYGDLPGWEYVWSSGDFSGASILCSDCDR